MNRKLHILYLLGREEDIGSLQTLLCKRGLRGVWIKVFGCKTTLENTNSQDIELPTRAHCGWHSTQGNLGLMNLQPKRNFSCQSIPKSFLKGKLSKTNPNKICLKIRAASALMH